MIYFLESVGTNLIKIGWMRQATDRRILDLRCGDSAPEHILHDVLPGDHKTERALHKHFAAF